MELTNITVEELRRTVDLSITGREKSWDSEPLWRHFWKTDALYYKLGHQIG